MGEDSKVAKYTSEFLGTFVLVFTIGCNVLSGQPVWGGVSIACSLMVMVYALAKSSGANFNPAVSVALGLSGKLPWLDVAVYIACQLAGGLAAGFAYVGLFEDGIHLAPTGEHTWWQAGLAETLYTFVLCFVVLNVAASSRHAGKNQFYGLAIGFVIVAGAYSGGSISMGCFNPAVAVGLDVSGTLGSGRIGAAGKPFYCAVYAAFELLGAALAAGLFRVVRPEDFGTGLPDGTPYPLSARLASEAVGTYVLVLTVGLNVLSESKAAAFSIAASLMCMIFALGSCSGAHFNPAVTAAVVCSGRGMCSPKVGAVYIGAQVSGGILSAFTYWLLTGGQSFPLKPANSTWQEVTIAEFIFTFVLCFVVLSVATTKTPLSEYFGLAIGMCVTVGGFAIGKVSGGSLNPAVSIGITSAHSISASGSLTGGCPLPCLIYVVVELIAGAAAAGVFKLTQPSEYPQGEGFVKMTQTNP